MLCVRSILLFLFKDTYRLIRVRNTMPKQTMSSVVKTLKFVSIENPKTGKNIKLSSALTYGSIYGKDDLAYKSAIEYLTKYSASKGIQIKGLITSKTASTPEVPSDAKVQLEVEPKVYAPSDSVESYNAWLASVQKVDQTTPDDVILDTVAKLGLSWISVANAKKWLGSISSKTELLQTINSQIPYLKKGNLPSYVQILKKNAPAESKPVSSVKLNKGIGEKPLQSVAEYHEWLSGTENIVPSTSSADLYDIAYGLGMSGLTDIPGMDGMTIEAGLMSSSPTMRAKSRSALQVAQQFAKEKKSLPAYLKTGPPGSVSQTAAPSATIPDVAVPQFKDKIKGVHGLTAKSSWKKQQQLLKLLGIKNDVLIPASQTNNGKDILVVYSGVYPADIKQKGIDYINNKLALAKKGLYTPEYFKPTPVPVAAPTTSPLSPVGTPAISGLSPLLASNQGYISAKSYKNKMYAAKYASYDKSTVESLTALVSDAQLFKSSPVYLTGKDLSIADAVATYTSLSDTDKRIVVDTLNIKLSRKRMDAVADAGYNIGKIWQTGFITSDADLSIAFKSATALGIMSDMFKSDMTGVNISVSKALSMPTTHPTRRLVNDYINSKVLEYYEKNPYQTSLISGPEVYSPPSASPAYAPPAPYVAPKPTSSPESHGLYPIGSPELKKLGLPARIASVLKAPETTPGKSGKVSKTALRQHMIPNPVTGKDIKVGSALSYGKLYGQDNPTYQAAIKYMADQVDSAISSLTKLTGVHTSLVDVSKAPDLKTRFEMDEYFKANYGTQYDELRVTHEDRLFAIKSYAGSYFTTMNRCLRFKEGCDKSDAQTLIADAKAIFKDVPETKEPMIVRRNMYTFKDFGAHVEDAVGGIMVDKAFVSTSGASGVSAMSGNIKLKINVPKGVKVLAVNALLRGQTPHGHESEILLPPGARFRITSVKRTGNNAGYNGLIHMEVDYLGSDDKLSESKNTTCKIMTEGIDIPHDDERTDKFTWNSEDVTFTPPTEKDRRLVKLLKIKASLKSQMVAPDATGE